MFLNHEFFELARPPFSSAPNAEGIFVTMAHQEAIAALVYGILDDKPLVALLGPIGVGKTTALLAALAAVTDERLTILQLRNPQVSPHELIEFVGRNLIEALWDAPAADRGRATETSLEPIQKNLRALRRSGSRAVLVIDEAHLASIETFHTIRLLSNLQEDGTHLLQTILVGQPELDEVLSQLALLPLRQRISVRATLAPLPSGQVREYVEHRLRLAGGTIGRTFTPAAFRAIRRRTHGVPRLINAACDAAMIAGFSANVRPVTRSCARQGLRALEWPKAESARRRRPLWHYALASVLVLAAALGGALGTGTVASDTVLRQAGLFSDGAHSLGRLFASAPPQRAIAATAQMPALSALPEPAAEPVPDPVVEPAAVFVPAPADIVAIEPVVAIPLPAPVLVALPPAKTVAACPAPVQAARWRSVPTRTYVVWRKRDSVPRLLVRWFDRTDPVAVAIFHQLNPELDGEDQLRPGQCVRIPTYLQTAGLP